MKRVKKKRENYKMLFHFFELEVFIINIRSV